MDIFFRDTVAKVILGMVKSIKNVCYQEDTFRMRSIKSEKRSA